MLVVNTTKANVRIRISADGDTGSTDFYIVEPQKRSAWTRAKPQVAFVYREDKSTTEVHFVDVDATLIVK